MALDYVNAEETNRVRSRLVRIAGIFTPSGGPAAATTPAGSAGLPPDG